MKDEPKKPEPECISVPEAGERYYGLGRNASYDAVKCGAIPVIKIGKLMKVPIRAMEAKLDRASRE
jgi:hypothetical protein